MNRTGLIGFATGCRLKFGRFACGLALRLVIPRSVCFDACDDSGLLHVPVKPFQDACAESECAFVSLWVYNLAHASCASSVRGLLHLETFPNVISLLAGKPNPATFPITSLSFRARNPLRDGAEEDYTLTPDEVAVALQYNMVAGVSGLVEWLSEFQSQEHRRPRDVETWRLSVGAGGQDMIYKVCPVILPVKREPEWSWCRRFLL